MERFIDPSASPWWLILFAIGWILIGAGLGIYYKYYRTHSVEQDNFYLKMTIAGAIALATSIFALWP